jgi:hypothetical protein
VVDCMGTCRVSCNATNPCTISCPDGAPPIACGTNLWACGSC